jgi:hypothetical protein
VRRIVRGVVVVDYHAPSAAKQAHSPFRDRQACLDRRGATALSRSQSFAGHGREVLRRTSPALALAAGAWRAMCGMPPASVRMG